MKRNLNPPGASDLYNTMKSRLTCLSPCNWGSALDCSPRPEGDTVGRKTWGPSWIDQIIFKRQIFESTNFVGFWDSSGNLSPLNIRGKCSEIPNKFPGVILHRSKKKHAQWINVPIRKHLYRIQYHHLPAIHESFRGQVWLHTGGLKKVSCGDIDQLRPSRTCEICGEAQHHADPLDFTGDIW